MIKTSVLIATASTQMVMDSTYQYFGNVYENLPTLTLGGCPNHEVVTDFDSDAYFGVWYEAAVSKNFRLWFGEGQCVTATYGLN